MQRVQLPQSDGGDSLRSDGEFRIFGSPRVAFFGLSPCSRLAIPKSNVVITIPKKTHDPNSRVIKQEFFPIHPRPACSAKARSRMGPVSA